MGACVDGRSAGWSSSAPYVPEMVAHRSNRRDPALRSSCIEICAALEAPASKLRLAVVDSCGRRLAVAVDLCGRRGAVKLILGVGLEL